MKNKFNILINITLCLFSFILAFGIAEYALRKIDIEELSGYKLYMNRHGNAEYYIIPGQGLLYKSGHCYSSDSTGLLPNKIVNPQDGKLLYCVSYDEKSRRKGYNPDRKRQIALVGDSFVFGEGVKETGTLGSLLNKKYPKINFQNWGVRGVDVGYVWEQCKKIIEAEPAVKDVIYFYNLNDIAELSTEGLETNAIIDFQNIRLLKDEQKSSALVKVLSRSKLFSLARKLWLIKWKSFHTIQNYKDLYLTDKGYSPGFFLTMFYIKSMKHMLETHGISFHMIIYPLIYKDMLGRYPFEGIHLAIINACKERGVICLDGYVPFKDYYSLKHFAVNPVDCHPNGLSNQKIVNYIWESNFITDRP